MRSGLVILGLLLAAVRGAAAGPPPRAEAINLAVPPEPAFAAWKQRVLARFAPPPTVLEPAWQEAAGALAKEPELAAAEGQDHAKPRRRARHHRWSRRRTGRAHKPEAAVSPQEQADLSRIRNGVLEKLKGLQGAAPAKPGVNAAATPAAPAKQPAETAKPTPKPPCPDGLDLYAWQGRGGFVDQLVGLRAADAHAGQSAAASARLAEFDLANGLANEAIAAVRSADAKSATAELRGRLARDADIARLARGRAIATDSPLLAPAASCERRDLPLWRALQAAATGDAQTVAAEAAKARLALDAVPTPLRESFALAIADAADDRATLGSMVAALRNRTDGDPAARATRLLIRARLAAAAGAKAEERQLLGQAVALGRTLPGLQAELRLAALDADRPGEAGTHAAAVLRDMARTYRFSRLGEQAAEALAEARLARGDYAGALALADEGTANHVAGESRGARLAARILRRLLVEPPRRDLPEPAARIALFWRYEGYATPGERGDDIRLGAVRLMLAQHLPEAALEVARQISPATAARPDAAGLIAMAEAEAEDGDAEKALAAPGTAGEAGRRAAAEALARLGRWREAATQLDPLSGRADRERRADLLFLARDWGASAAAYAALLRDPALGQSERSLAAARFGLAVALDGAPPAELPAGASAPADPAARRLFALAEMPPASPSGANPVSALRDALARAKRIETMLNP